MLNLVRHGKMAMKEGRIEATCQPLKLGLPLTKIEHVLVMLEAFGYQLLWRTSRQVFLSQKAKTSTVHPPETAMAAKKKERRMAMGLPYLP